LPVHFVTLAHRAQPLVRHHIEQFKRLSFRWHWHIVAGACQLTPDLPLAPAIALGEDLPIAFGADEEDRDADGTWAYLDLLAREFPEQVTIYRMPTGAVWEGKSRMLGAPLANMNEPALLWRVDPDELWSAEQLARGRELFLERPEKTAAWYWCWFFVGPDRVVASRGGYGNDPGFQWVRTWRYRPGMQWASYEPPRLAQPLPDGSWRDVAAVNPFRHAETENAGLVFQHYAYATREQLALERWYYGDGVLARWEALQSATSFPQPLRDYFPWVTDETPVEPAGRWVPRKLMGFPVKSTGMSTQNGG
jgi:hypothetical protein